MSELRELYQSVILDHNKKPRNFGSLEDPDRSADGHNPLCGDVIHLTLKLEDDVVREVRFEGSGCAISTAAASMMTQSLKGKTVAEAGELFKRFHELVTGSGEADDAALGKLAVFSGVREFPVRVKCATLAWHTLKAALEDREAPVSTE